MSTIDRRAHLRYRDPKTTAQRFLIKDGETEKAITGLIANESHNGLACVYIGSAIEAASEIVWQETKHIQTRCKVLRCEKLYRGVFLLALQIVDSASAMDLQPP